MRPIYGHVTEISRILCPKITKISEKGQLRTGIRWNKPRDLCNHVSTLLRITFNSVNFFQTLSAIGDACLKIGDDQFFAS